MNTKRGKRRIRLQEGGRETKEEEEEEEEQEEEEGEEVRGIAEPQL